MSSPSRAIRSLLGLVVNSAAIASRIVHEPVYDERFKLMTDPIAEATAYLDKLESERLAAIANSEQKAEEAKLIGARREGFPAAIELLTGATSATSCKLRSDKPSRRRPRRDIVQLILREMSFNAKAMTSAQIAQAIVYIPERTETALKRLETGGKVIRDEHGRWIIATTVVNDKMTPTAVFKSSGPGSPVAQPYATLTRNGTAVVVRS